MEFNPTQELWNVYTNKARDARFRSYLSSRYALENYAGWVAITELMELIRKQALEHTDLRNRKFFQLVASFVDTEAEMSITFTLEVQHRAKRLRQALEIDSLADFDVRLLFDMIKEVEVLLQQHLKAFCFEHPLEEDEAQQEEEEAKEEVHLSCTPQVIVRAAARIESPKKIRNALTSKPFSDRRRKIVLTRAQLQIMHANSSRGVKFELPLADVEQRSSRRRVLVLVCGSQEFTLRFKEDGERDSWERVIMENRMQLMSEATLRRKKQRKILEAPLRLALTGQFDTSAGFFTGRVPLHRSESSLGSSTGMDLRLSGGSKKTSPRRSPRRRLVKEEDMKERRHSMFASSMPLFPLPRPIDEDDDDPALCVSSDEEEEDTLDDESSSSSSSASSEPAHVRPRSASHVEPREFRTMLKLELPHQMSEGSLVALLGADARDAIRKRNKSDPKLPARRASEQKLGYVALPTTAGSAHFLSASSPSAFDPTLLEPSFETDESSSTGDEAPQQQQRIDILREASMKVVGQLKHEAKEVRHFEHNLYDWNAVFQEKIQYLTMFQDHSDPTVMEHIYTGLIRLGEDFIKNAKNYGRIIINERYLDTEFKTIKPSLEMGGSLGGEKYRVHNIMFKFAHDSTGLFRGSDEYAAKVAGHELKGLSAYFQVCNNKLHFPLMALIDYKGFRLVASSMLPLAEGSLLYGSEDGGRKVHTDDEQLNKLVADASAALNLKAHRVGTEGETVSSPADLEGHKGADGKYYLLDFSRVMPPVTPDPKFPGSHLFQLFRQEFVCSFPLMSLCSDAYSSFVAGQEDEKEHSREIDAATHDLKGITLSNFARELAHALAEEVKVHNTLKDFPITQEIHRRGINVRYLGLLAIRLGPSKYSAFLLAHMCARLIKKEIRSRLRERMAELKLVVDEPYRMCVAEYLNMVFSETPKSRRYWSEVITAGLNSKFNLRPSNWRNFPENLRRTIWDGIIFRNGHVMDLRMYMLDMVREMTGLRLTESLLKVLRAYPETWNQARVFSDTDLIDLGERVKMLDVISKAKGRVFTMRGEEKQKLGLLPSALELYRQALVAFEEALSGTPLNTDLLRACAITMLRAAIIEQALACNGTEDVTAIPPNTPIMVRANRCFVRALQGDPSNSFTHLSYAKFLVLTSQFEAAEDHFLQALHYNPCMLKALAAYSEFLELVRKDARASQEFSQRCEQIRRYITVHADEIQVPSLKK